MLMIYGASTISLSANSFLNSKILSLSINTSNTSGYINPVR